jgi:hypothetical protein
MSFKRALLETVITVALIALVWWVLHFISGEVATICATLFTLVIFCLSGPVFTSARFLSFLSHVTTFGFGGLGKDSTFKQGFTLRKRRPK